jgi:hypothetical protein
MLTLFYLSVAFCTLFSLLARTFICTVQNVNPVLPVRGLLHVVLTIGQDVQQQILLHCREHALQISVKNIIYD